MDGSFSILQNERGQLALQVHNEAQADHVAQEGGFATPDDTIIVDDESAASSSSASLPDRGVADVSLMACKSSRMPCVGGEGPRLALCLCYLRASTWG